MGILPLQPDDLPQMRELQPADWPDIFPALEFYLKKTFCHPVKVVENDRIIGLGTTYLHGDTAWLAHIIVHPGERNRGIGLMITKALIEDAKKHVHTIYLTATPLGEPVYKKVGFITEGEYAFLKREGEPLSGNVSANIFSYDEDRKEEIFSLDKEIMCEDRRSSIENHLAGARLYIENGTLLGVALPTWNEGLIIASTSAAGLALLHEKTLTTDWIAVPADNTAAMEFLLSNGFKELKRAKRMRLGKERAWQPSKLYSRVGGNVG